MSISVTSNKVRYAGDGASTDFAFTFKAFASGDIDVYTIDSEGELTLKTLTTHYTLDLDDGEGGTVTFLSAPASTVDVLIIRASSFVQATDYEEESNFREGTVETTEDKITTYVQELKERVDRCLSWTLATEFSGQPTVYPEGNGGSLLGLSEDEDELVFYTADEIADLAEGTFSAQVDVTLANNQSSAASVTGLTIDADDYEHAELLAIIERTTSTTTVVSFQRWFLRYVSSSWEIEQTLGNDRSGVAHGITLTVDTTSGVGQVKYTSTNLGGTDYVGTGKFKFMRFGA